MNAFALDLWHDLREKRLWPVAVLLAVGILALPLLLLKGSDSELSAPAPARGATASTVADPAVKLTKDARGAAVGLDRAHPKNTFQSTEPKPGKGAATGVGGVGGPSVSQSVPSPGLTSGGSSGSGSTGGGSTGGGSTGGGSTGGGSTGGGSTGGSTTGSPSDPSSGFDQNRVITRSRKLVAYKFTVDVDFGLRGQKLARRKSVDQLQALPKGEHPLLIFLGITSDGRRAAFGVAPSLGAQTGEGSCRPTRTRCPFLYLRTDAKHNGHELRAPDGRVYVIRVRAIRKERLRKAAASSAQALPALAAGVAG